MIGSEQHSFTRHTRTIADFQKQAKANTCCFNPSKHREKKCIRKLLQDEHTDEKVSSNNRSSPHVICKIEQWNSCSKSHGCQDDSTGLYAFKLHSIHHRRIITSGVLLMCTLGCGGPETTTALGGKSTCLGG